MDDWQPVSTAPAGVWLRTRLDGEDGENVCALRRWGEGEADEWIERATGFTTVTHHSFAAPSHWKPL